MAFQCSLSSLFSENSKNNILSAHHLPSSTDSEAVTTTLKTGYCTTSSAASSSSLGLSFNDIGYCIGQNIDNHTKMTLLENHWFPPNNCKFPFLQEMYRVKSSSTMSTQLICRRTQNGLCCQILKNASFGNVARSLQIVMEGIVKMFH